MAFDKTYTGVDDRGRRYVDLVSDAAESSGANANAAAAAAIDTIPFVGARQVLVTPTGHHGAIKIDKADVHDAISASALETLLATLAQTNGIGVRVIGP